MIRVQTVVTIARRTLPIPVATAFLTAALLGLLTPAAATPAAPYFGPNVQVDQAPGHQGSQPSLTIGSDGVVYLAYSGWGGPSTGADVFFTKSSDGRTWTTPVRVNDDTAGAAQTEPVLTLDRSNNVYIAWTDARSGNNDVYFSKSTTGGLSFAPNVRVNIDVTTNGQTEPSIAVDPVNPHLIHAVWTDTRTPLNGPDIYYINSTDGGLSFNPPSIRVNTDVGGAEQGAAAIAVAPDRAVDVVWRDPRNAGKGPDIYFVKSTDLGATWGTVVVVNHDTGNAVQQEPTIAVNATGSIFVAWTDSQFTSTAPDIAATVSTNGGASFAVEVRVNDDTGSVAQGQPSLAVSGNKVQLAWSDYRRGGPYPYDVFASSSSDGLTWSSNMQVTGDSNGNFELTPAVGVDQTGDVIVAWVDLRSVSILLEQKILASILDVLSPTADAGSPSSIDQGALASFDASGSSDNLGIASYKWVFGDGTSGAGVTTSHAYVTPGGYIATLIVWDYSGNSATATVQVTVQDTQAPVVRGAGDRLVDEGQPLFFDGSASSDNVAVASYAWNFGDGTTATTATASHVYARPGAYAATLTVTDAAGNSATSSFTVTVRSSALLGMIQMLEGLIALLVIVLALLGWMVWGMRKREQHRRMPPVSPMSPMSPVSPPPGAPPAQPPREPDPLDMPLPGTPPKQP